MDIKSYGSLNHFINGEEIEIHHLLKLKDFN